MLKECTKKNLYTEAGFTKFITSNTSYLSERRHVTMRTQTKCYARLTFVAILRSPSVVNNDIAVYLKNNINVYISIRNSTDC